MTNSEIILALATLLGPLVAVQLTRYLDDRKERQGRKLQIFKILMATRAIPLSNLHVEALNLIDLEFRKGRKEKAVIHAWKAYLDLLGDRNMPREMWVEKKRDMLTDLLQKMAIVLDYEFDATHIRNSIYYPDGHGKLEEEQNALRLGLIEVLEGKRPIPMSVVQFPNDPEFLDVAKKLYLQALSGDLKLQLTNSISEPAKK